MSRDTTLYLKWFNPAVSITTDTLPSVVASSQTYNQTLAATSEMPVTWSITSGILPTGLTLTSTTGVIYGTPSAYGTYTFTAKADNGVQSTSKTFSITVGIRKVVLEEGFETGIEGWTLVNGSETNKWVIGTNTKYSGTYSVYISSDASTNSYTTTSSSIVHLYKDIEFPVPSSNFTLTFYIKGTGDQQHNMTVRYGPTNSTPVAGSEFIGGTQLGSAYYLNSYWQQKSITLPAETFSGTTKRLVFSWTNDNIGDEQPPAANTLYGPAKRMP